MNSEIVALQYRKAKIFMQNRPRRVTFAHHHRLYRSVKLSEDLKILEREKYNPAGPLESRVWGERLEQDALESYMTLIEANFWPMVFSNKWSQYSSIRVTEGALLDSLLLTYYTLVTEGKLLTYTTELYQENVRTKPRRKKQRTAGKENKPETIKISFTYYSRTAEELSKAVEIHQGVSITDDDIRQQNPAVIPKIISDVMQSSMTCSTFPEWTKQSSDGDEGDDDQNKTGDLLVPENPPNSPTPLRKHVTLKYTHSETNRRYDQKVEMDNMKTAREYSHLPLVMRTRHNGLASRPVEGITVIGQKLDQSYQVLPPSQAANGQIIFLRNRSTIVSRMSIPRLGRHRFNRPMQLPSINGACDVNTIHKNPKDRRRQSLQMKLVESNHLHDVDICKTAFIPHKVQFINVVNSLQSPVDDNKADVQPTFDTDKLRINSSLEKMRPDFVRPPIRKVSPHLPERVEKPPAGSGKSYVMQKYLEESSSHLEDCQSLKSSGRSEDYASSLQQSLRFSSDTTEIPPLTFEYYKQRLPSDFMEKCLEATGCFVVKKEHVTLSRLYKTVTSLTISKIPDGGYQRWKYAS